MTEKMSNKYRLNVPFWTVLPIDVFRNPIKSLKVEIFERFLNRLWTIMSEA